MISLADIKSYLGIVDNSYDTFLTEQEAVISDAVEGYCGRKFSAANYIQNFYVEDYRVGINDLALFHYPVNTITHVKEKIADPATEFTITADVRVQKTRGNLFLLSGFFQDGDFVEVSYNAGFATIPPAIKSVVLSLIEERYNKKISGVSLNFGSDVQGIAIPGTISVQFDYSLQANERKTAYGTILGNYINVLDIYRSERRVIGSGTIQYVG